MAATAKKTDPGLWDKVKKKVTKGDKGGKPGQWSARKAQMAVQAYKAEGGGYEGRKTADNHLRQWTEEEWGTRSGHSSRESGERYLPKKARKALSSADYARTTRKKRADTRKGKQFSAQPADVARKTARFRNAGAAQASGGGETRAALYAEARRRNIPGRSQMTKADLARALTRPAKRS